MCSNIVCVSQIQMAIWRQWTMKCYNIYPFIFTLFWQLVVISAISNQLTGLHFLHTLFIFYLCFATCALDKQKVISSWFLSLLLINNYIAKGWISQHCCRVHTANVFVVLYGREHVKWLLFLSIKVGCHQWYMLCSCHIKGAINDYQSHTITGVFIFRINRFIFTLNRVCFIKLYIAFVSMAQSILKAIIY